jgi:hypothetical protein
VVRLARANAAFVVAILLVCAGPSYAYSLEGPRWAGATIPMLVQLGTPTTVLPDGFITWNADAENCLQQWNEQLGNVQLTWTEAPVGSPAAQRDGKNSVLFSNTVFGKSFGDRVLAVTTYFSSSGFMTEADVVFNTSVGFSSGGTVKASKDFHRVALHEFGHVLGLDHPDEHGQTVSAIMNSLVSNLNHLTADDVAGITALYGLRANRPPVTGASRLSNISTRARVSTGDNVMIAGFIIRDQTKPVLIRALGPTLANFGVVGPLADPKLVLHNQNGSVIFANNNWQDSQATDIEQTGLAPPNAIESAIKITLSPGNYTGIVSGNNNGVGVGLVEVYDLNTPAGRAYNISTRAQVATGQNVMIAGFIVKGPQLKTMVIRAIGPGLQGLVPGPLPDTKIELRNGASQLMLTNIGWQTDPNSPFVSFYQLAPRNTKDSAIYAQLGPGKYTVIFSSASNAVGIGLVEVYDED